MLIENRLTPQNAADLNARIGRLHDYLQREAGGQSQLPRLMQLPDWGVVVLWDMAQYAHLAQDCAMAQGWDADMLQVMPDDWFEEWGMAVTAPPYLAEQIPVLMQYTSSFGPTEDGQAVFDNMMAQAIPTGMGEVK